MSFNLYAYCINNPVNYVDRGGNDVYYIYDPYTFFGNLDTNNVKTDIQDIENDLRISKNEIIPMPVKSVDEFVDSWNSMDDNNGENSIDAVIIYCHAGSGAFQPGNKVY